MANPPKPIYKDTPKQTEATSEASAPLESTPAPEVKVVNTTPAPEVKSTETTDFEGAYQEYLSGKKGVTLQGFFANVENYMKVMAPGIMLTSQQGAANQYQFWLALKDLLDNSTEAEFRRAWTVFLWKVDTSPNSVFNHRYLYRFFDGWDKKSSVEKALQNLFDLILQTCKAYKDPEYKTQKKAHFNLNAGLSKDFTPAARTKLSQYYPDLMVKKT